ncbi:hypothetical protein [Candidatus Regiella endosymbiont of Tuberolachnus salignus]|uniref:hypothetical protein n=1 Tax=Candidatus Regiella endosymbiont of Tuberolachnus salignus TaxID=3077956 RepID=UPI0030CF5E30
MTHPTTSINRHSKAYRGFTITYLPKTATQPMSRYHLWLDNQSFGKVDALAQATDYIDQLHQMKKIARREDELFHSTLDIHHDVFHGDYRHPGVPKETHQINRLATIAPA